VARLDHGGLGWDLDGATMPRALADVAAQPALLAALRDDGFGEAEIEQIAWGNWRRVLALAWG
jgi:membrane dipeptidase